MLLHIFVKQHKGEVNIENTHPFIRELWGEKLGLLIMAT